MAKWVVVNGRALACYRECRTDACFDYLAGMDRATFLSASLSWASGWLAPGIPRPWLQRAESLMSEAPPVVIPPYLVTGDRIGITSPAGFIREADILPAVERLMAWGFEVRVGASIGKRDGTFGGTDDERTADLQEMIDDPAIKAILCARGGYGISRILDRLDLSRLTRHPKWVIGFSDITAFQLDLQRKCRMASLHAKMCNSFPADWAGAEPIVRDTISSIYDALTGARMSYDVLPHPMNRPGTGKGLLVGGNLSVIQHCMGTPSEPITRGGILFLEDVGEYRYNIDRMLTNLQRAGKLRDLAGLIIGGFTRIRTESPGDEFGKEVAQMVMEKLEGRPFPVCFDFPVGHQRNNVALKSGVMHSIDVRPQGVRLLELR